jgi:hypothetical protein
MSQVRVASMQRVLTRAHEGGEDDNDVEEAKRVEMMRKAGRRLVCTHTKQRRCGQDRTYDARSNNSRV